MGFREDLDLSGIVDRFEVFGGNPANGLPTYLRERAEQEQREALTAYQSPGEGETPAPAGSGPLACSTSRQVAVGGQPWAWDPNRLYRALGMAWPYVHATRRDLMHAYREVDGQSSVRATFAFKMLLNREFREYYDGLPLGEIWMSDPQVQDRLKARAEVEASSRSAEGLFTTREEVLDEWGFEVVRPEPDDDTPPKVVDNDHLERFDDDQHERSVGPGWEYSYYLWRTTRWDTARLSAWQSLLIAEIDPEVSPRLTVGLMGRQPQAYCIAQVQGGWVVFLSVDAEATPEIAAEAAHRLHNEMRYAARAR